MENAIRTRQVDLQAVHQVERIPHHCSTDFEITHTPSCALSTLVLLDLRDTDNVLLLVSLPLEGKQNDEVEERRKQNLEEQTQMDGQPPPPVDLKLLHMKTLRRPTFPFASVYD